MDGRASRSASRPARGLERGVGAAGAAGASEAICASIEQDQFVRNGLGE